MKRPARPLAIASLLLVATVAAPAGEKPSAAPHEVQVHTEVVLKDARRGKDLAVRLYHPRDGGPYPVVIFSHGYGGNKDAFAYLSTFWASRGYVCIHPTHADAGLLTAKNLKGEEPLPGLTDPERWRERVGDVAFLLDSLERLSEQVPALKGKLDRQRIGVAGHSFGAYTAMVAGGVTVDLDGKRDQSLADPRVRAILPISPQGAGAMGLTERSWRGLRLPMMTVAGSKDAGRGGKAPSWRQEPFDRSPAGDKYELFFDRATHFSYGGRFGPEYIAEALKTASLAFWDAYLKEAPQARDFLQGNGLADLNPSKLTIRRK